MAVINKAGNVIALLLVKLQLILLFTLSVSGELPQLDYGSLSASLEEDAIDPLTAMAPFANSWSPKNRRSTRTTPSCLAIAVRMRM